MSTSSALYLDPQRRSVCLNGAWQSIIDPYENGYYEGFVRNEKPTCASDRIEYDFDTSPTLQVPGDWNSQRPELLFYEGTIWYKRDFAVAATPNRRRFLHFGAANYAAQIWVNGEFVGEHVGGFTPFCFEVTQHWRDANNYVVVKVDNRRLATAVPALNTDWWNYGGLTRDVHLVDVPDTCIHSWHLALDSRDPKLVRVWVQLDGPELDQEIVLSLPEVNLQQTAKTNAQGRADFEISVALERWTPEAPKLYDVRILCGADSVTDSIGFRTVRVVGDQVLVNDQPTFLRGICVHEEAPFRSGRATSREDAMNLLGWAKELGCNFVRLAHYPHNEWMVRAADELGLMLWCEIPVYWAIAWTNPETLALAERQLTDMIERDRNRAAVIIWSVGNETPISDERLTFMKHLVSVARCLDRTRLVSAALERHYDGPTTQVIDDPLGAELDVIGCNEYIGWYDGLPERAESIEWQVAYKKPVLVSEFGADARQGMHGGPLDRWTEEFQANVYERQLAMLERLPHCCGMTPWLLMDFRSPRRTLPGILDYYNRKGLVSDRGLKKLAFGTLRDYYLRRKAT